MIDITEQVFGYWTVLGIDRSKKRKYGRTHWNCECVCGTVRSIQSTNLKTGKTVSCGCKRAVDINNSAFKRTYNSYAANAKNRGLEFLLTKEEFLFLTQQNCYYCGKPPSNHGKTSLSQKKIGAYFYNGLDRINNKMGYTLSNVLPCCARDNILRSKTLTVEETKAMVVALEDFRKKNGHTPNKFEGRMRARQTV